ncbi:MAG: RHS repeat-associated core domain-containing protein [Cyanobacteria bacterium J06638_38]
MVTVDSSGDVIERNEYTYDVNDNRIAKSVDADGDGSGAAVVERFVHDGAEIALVFDGDGNQTERYFHGVGIDEVLAVEKANDEVIWALADHQGTVRVLMDSTGAVVNQISYDSFGNVTAQTNTGVSFRFGYTGREFDPETGLYYYRARYYDPEVGQFISQDAIGFNAGDMNLYRYVTNSPINYSDPSGNVPVPVLLFAGGFLFDSAVQIISNGGLSGYDWKQATITGLSTAIGGPLAGKLLAPGASLATRMAVNGLVSGVVDGSLTLGRNALEGKCDVFEGVAQQAITGGAGGALGEVAEVGIKAAAPHVKNLMNAAGDAVGGLYKGASEAITSAFGKSADKVATTSDEVFEDVSKNVEGATSETLMDGSQTAFELQQRLLSALDFRQRSIELGFDASRNQLLVREGIGAARFERATGRTVSRTVDGAVDFKDSVLGEFDLKGPIRANDGSPIPITDKRVQGLARSVIKEVNRSTASKAVVVDTLGLSPLQISRLKNDITQGVKVNKPIIYIE